MKITKNKKERIHHCLLIWYDQHARELPWRENRNPYRVWVSEIMLQQTQVVTVVPYFQRFMEKFPDVAKLASSQLEEVYKIWQGLGYYSRARHLHQAAKQIVNKFSNQLPDNFPDLLSLPGIGRYTAGAILSIAYDQPTAILDGNVIRVLCRLFQIEEEPASSQVRNRLWGISEELVCRERPGDFNQALMELGAMVCTPKQPGCQECPLQSICRAKKSNNQGRLPVKRVKTKVPHYTIGIGVIQKGNRVLIGQRLPDGLLGGLWEFPGGKQEAEESIEQTIVRECNEEMGIEIKPTEYLMTVKHAYSHFRVTLIVWICRHIKGRARPLGCQQCRWIALGQLGEYPFPTANRKIIDRLLSPAD